MRWQGRRGSDNVVDKTKSGKAAGKKPRSPAKERSKKGVASAGLGTLLLTGLLMAFGFSGSEVETLLDDSTAADVRATAQPTPALGDPANEDQSKQFVSVVLADTEEVWRDLFAERGLEYTDARLVLFEGKVRTGCGRANASTGPFYCPADEKVYLDLSFFDELSQDLGAPGDFAQAYIIGHEIGHHVQNLTGVLAEVEKKQRRRSEKFRNELDVRCELQADYYAGVWAHHAQKRFKILEEGDIEEALDAASAIGDDTLQKAEQGYVQPDTFTHGTSKQRARWFKKGFQRGDWKGGDTFGAKRL
jgi:predicted metalloprotease